MTTLRILKCFHGEGTDKPCREPVYGYRINRDGIQFELCRDHYDFLYQCYDDSEQKMKVYRSNHAQTP